MEDIQFLASCVDFQQRMVDDAISDHARLLTKYQKIDALRAMTDQHVAASADNILKLQADLEAAKATHAAAANGEVHPGPETDEGDG